MATRWLVGMMGAGKSTIGRAVAERLGVRFVDTDDEVVRRTGRSIEEWFALSPEGFRRVEEAVVESLAGDDLVVACGGGAVLSERSRAVMAAHGSVVWLRAASEVLVERVGDGSGRPLLGGDPHGTLESLLAERQSLYEAVADAVVDAGRPLDEVVEAVMGVWIGSS